MTDPTANVTSAVGFDYASLDEQTRFFVVEQTQKIHFILKFSAHEVGRILIEVKDKLGHGKFYDWLAAEFRWTERTAEHMMNVAEIFKSEKISDLPLATTALYILASPSTPAQAREEALTRAAGGEKITPKKAKEIKQKYVKPKGFNEQQIQSNQEKSDLGAEQDSSIIQITSSNEIKIDSPVVSLPIKEPQKTFSKPNIVAFQRNHDIFSLLKPGTWWQLGEHRLYCGEPTAKEFEQQLPDIEIALALAFPPIELENWPVRFGKKAISAFSFFSQYQDLDVNGLREIIKSSIELCTDEKETVIFYYFPDPIFLILVNDLGCRCFMAEPSVNKCADIIKAWLQTKRKVELLNL